MDVTKQPGVQFSQIFLSEAHFSHRADALSLPPETKVSSQPISVEARVVASETGEAVALIVRVSTGKIEPEPLYSFLAEMTAIIAAIPGQQNLRPSDFASAQGLATLYPFLREAVANLTARGRFGPVYLLPFNFTAAEISREAPVRAAAVAEGADIAAVEATKKRRAIGVRRIGRK